MNADPGWILAGWITAAASYTFWSVPLILDDLRERRLPDNKVLYMSAGVITGLVMYAAGNGSDSLSPVLTGVTYSILLAGMRILSKGGMGGGDVKLAFPSGITSGLIAAAAGMSAWIGFLIALITTFAAGFTASVLIILARLCTKADNRTFWKTMKDSTEGDIPFGPFIIAGVVVSSVLFWLSTVYPPMREGLEMLTSGRY